MKYLISTALLFCASTALAQTGTPGAHFLQNWDLDSNGVVAAAELAEKRNDLFVAFDADEDGSLSADEYAAFDAARIADQAQLGAGRGGAMQRLEAPMARGFNDKDGNGVVSLAEWSAASPQMFAALDNNGDGEITLADFGRP
jgi:hypothetical protein